MSFVEFFLEKIEKNTTIEYGMKEKNSIFTENRPVAHYIQQWGHASSIALLDSACNIFSIPEVDGIIGYRIESQCAVVFGNPVCSPQDIPLITQAFHDHHQELVKNIIYIATSESFVTWALQQRCGSAIGIGNEIILDPLQDPKKRTGKRASLLRNKYNQSIRDGVVVKEYADQDRTVEQEIEGLRKTWIQSRKGPQIFLFKIDLFTDRSNTRWFYAEHKNKIIGVIVLNRIDAYQGWVLNRLMLLPQAPNSTSEYMILSVLDALRNEGCNFFSIGTVPSSQMVTVRGLGVLSTWFVHRGFKIAKKFFQLDERQRYWKKFEPRVEPNFVIFSKPRVGFREMMGIMRALNANI